MAKERLFRSGDRCDSGVPVRNIAPRREASGPLRGRSQATLLAQIRRRLPIATEVPSIHITQATFGVPLVAFTVAEGMAERASKENSGMDQVDKAHPRVAVGQLTREAQDACRGDPRAVLAEQRRGRPERSEELVDENILVVVVNADPPRVETMRVKVIGRRGHSHMWRDSLPRNHHL